MGYGYAAPVDMAFESRMRGRLLRQPGQWMQEGRISQPSRIPAAIRGIGLVQEVGDLN